MIQPGRRYTPTPAEWAEAARTGRYTFDVKFSLAADGPEATRMTLEYFVPYSAFPQDLLQQILGQPAAATRFEFMSSAWAQDEGGLGAAMSMGSKIGKNFNKITSALDKSEEHADWMKRLDDLENCARNPTSPLTQNAYRRDPRYQQQTIDAIEAARSEVKQATAMRFLNQETSVATGLVGGPLKNAVKATGSVSSWNDSTLKYIAEQRIADISKSVDCELPNPPRLDPGDGTIKYHMHREGYLDYDEEDRITAGQFDLRPGPQAGSVILSGEGTFKGGMSAAKVGTSAKCQGDSEIHGSGYAGDLWIHGGPVSGRCQFIDHGKVTEYGPQDSDTAFSCTFHKVDLVNGGSYEVRADGEESAWTTCSLDLKPQQK